jgi:hypothetical protein
LTASVVGIAGYLVILGFAVGQFMVGLHVMGDHPVVLGLWSMGCIAEVWLLFIKVMPKLLAWAQQRDAEAYRRRYG